MTGTQFRDQHGDPTTWTTADIEAQQNLAACDTLPATTAPTTTPQDSANRLRQLLAPTN